MLTELLFLPCVANGPYGQMSAGASPLYLVLVTEFEHGAIFGVPHEVLVG